MNWTLLQNGLLRKNNFSNENTMGFGLLCFFIGKKRQDSMLQRVVYACGSVFCRICVSESKDEWQVVNLRVYCALWVRGCCFSVNLEIYVLFISAKR